MASNSFYTCSHFVLFLVVLCHHGAVIASSIGDKFINFTKFEDSVFREHPADQIIGALDRKYRELFTSEININKLKKSSNKELAHLFLATDSIINYTNNASYVADLRIIASVMEERKILTNIQIETLFNVFVSVRQIAEAEAWAKRHPHMQFEVLPVFQEAASFSKSVKSEWNVSLESRVLERRNFSFKQNGQVIVTVHPQCHFSTNAISAIMSSPELSKALIGNVKWLVPQNRKLDFNIIQNWNKKHPYATMALTFHSHEWPEIEAWDTPNFYFFNNGTLVSRFAGWPRAGNKEKLIEGLKKIGLWQNATHLEN